LHLILLSPIFFSILSPTDLFKIALPKGDS